MQIEQMQALLEVYGNKASGKTRTKINMALTTVSIPLFHKN